MKTIKQLAVVAEFNDGKVRQILTDEKTVYSIKAVLAANSEILVNETPLEGVKLEKL